MEHGMDFGGFVYHPENNSSTLTILTLVLGSFGISLSIVALLILFLTALLFQEWRQKYKNQLLLQFMTARFINTSVRYIHDMFNVFNYKVQFNPILVYIFLIIYSDMALVTWMYVFSKHMYDRFVRVCYAENYKLWKISLCAWLIPVSISIILYSLYSIPGGKDLFFLIIYQMIIKWPVLCVNGIQLVQILRYILRSNLSKSENNYKIVLLIIILIFTFSIQQAIGDIIMLIYVITYKTYERVPFLFTLFNIVSVYQCGITIFFWLFGNTRTRKLWAFKDDKDIIRSSINNDRPFLP